MSAAEHMAWADRLAALGHAVRARLTHARRSGDDLTKAVGHEGGDTIFAIDRHVEPVIEDVICGWPDVCKPLMVVAEGFGEDGRKRFGDAATPAKVRLIIDPIDGTRTLMYDKRSAWFIAAAANDRGDQTRLSDCFAAALVELPTTKQTQIDTFTAVRGQGVTARRTNLSTDETLPMRVASSGAATLVNGFAQVANFFPGTKALAADLMERIVRDTVGSLKEGSADVFDDQYITTAGQMVELMVGHDRFCCDLRPLFYDILQQDDAGAPRGHECHPYDLAGMLAAQEAGVILTDGFGRPLDAPLDVHTGVHWCGYANTALHAKIEPVIQGWLQAHGIRSSA